MAQSIQFTCDVCGEPKKEGNHWWKAGVDVDVFMVTAWNNPLDPCEIDDTILHLCGRACVLRKVEEFMEAPTPALEKGEESTELEQAAWANPEGIS